MRFGEVTLMMATQLDLWEEELLALPWRGRSPRTLTRVQLALIFKPEAQKHECFFVDVRQFELFRAAKPKLPGKASQGAPLLWPLEGE